MNLAFAGKVVLITGGARNLGRAMGTAFATAGASIAINARAQRPEMAETIAAIEAVGGKAISCIADITNRAEVDRMVEAIIKRFGRLDILINNAGIIRWAGFPDADEQNLASHLAVHTVGSFNTARAAWPHMCAAGYGRIVMTTSSGMFGLSNNVSYATAKAAVVGLTRSLAVAGKKHGIAVNLIAPAAMTRMAGGDGESPAMPPELVAPMAAFLAHEDCHVSGEMYAAGAGRFARIFFATTPGYVHQGPDVTVEDVAEHWAAINDETGYAVPANLREWSAGFLAHLPPQDG